MKASVVGLLLGAVLLAGCGEKPRPAEPAAEIRGAPIRPAAAKTPAAANAEAPANPTAPGAAAVNVPVASAVRAPAESPISKATGGAYPLVGFDTLSGYEVEISDELLGPVTNNLEAITAKTDALIPKTVKAFNQKRSAIKGFMLPLKVEGGLVTELLIMRDQSMCCYGTVPKIHEWVSVKMTGAGVKPLMDQPVTLFGTLHIGEMRENGYLTGIYRMDGERMQAPED